MCDKSFSTYQLNLKKQDLNLTINNLNFISPAVKQYGWDLSIKSLYLYSGEVEMPIQIDPILPANWKRADHLQCCLYMSDDGAHTKSSGSMGKEENSKKMFALAMKMQFQPIKNVKVSSKIC